MTEKPETLRPHGPPAILAGMETDLPLTARLILASRFENIEVAERALLDLCAQAGHDSEEETYWLVTALREAVANAVRHGNRENPDASVRVEIDVGAEEVRIRVADEGEGFDPSELPDPTDPEHLLRSSGRGIFYMRQFMNRVDFRRGPTGGTIVDMSRRLDPPARSRDDEE